MAAARTRSSSTRAPSARGAASSRRKPAVDDAVRRPTARELELHLVEVCKELAVARSSELELRARNRFDATSLYIIAIVLVCYGVWVASIAGHKRVK